MGELRVLNCSAGDIRVKFDKTNSVELIRARKMIGDMLRRGYLLAIEIDGKLEPVHKFDVDKDEYIIIESVTSSPLINDEAKKSAASADRKQTPSKKSTKSRRVPMESTNVIAIPRTAGG